MCSVEFVIVIVPLISTSCKALRKIPGTMFASLTISIMTFREAKRRSRASVLEIQSSETT
jgi:uncharacterized membrane protein